MWMKYMSILFFLKIRRQPRSTPTDTLFPSTTLYRAGLLPLDKTDATIAVIGPSATSLIALEGNYNGTPTAPVRPLDAMETVFGADRVTYAQGAPFVANRLGEDTFGLQSIMRNPYCVFWLEKTNKSHHQSSHTAIKRIHVHPY